MTQPLKLRDQVATLASQCVRCGLCLPKCPTYQLSGCEAESPRGRIALLAALAADELTPDRHFAQHLDQCLGCRACETVCPAEVRYEDLLIAGRALQHQKTPVAASRRLSFLVEHVTRSPKSRHRLAQVYRLAEQSGLLALARVSGLTRLLKLERPLSYLPQPLPKPFSASTHLMSSAPSRGHVALLLGCSADVLEPQTVHDAILLLQRWGFRVSLPPGQTCCGALHAHAGLLTAAAAFATDNTAALQAAHRSQAFDALISLTPGCASTWQSYAALPAKVIDIQRFLLDHWPAELVLNELPHTIAVHEPCSQRHSLRESSLSLSLLTKIPGMRCIPFGTTTCCGAAGDYFLEHPDISDRLSRLSFDPVLALPALNGVASANIGCRLQFAKQWAGAAPTGSRSSTGGRTSAGGALRFYHPISLLALALA